jgi:hypothetical protein
MNVRRFLGVVPLIVAAIPVAALARDCDEVKASIDAKIKAKGVMNFVLQIVNGLDVSEGKTVGNCDAGAKRIVYFRQGDPSASKVLAPEKVKKNELAELAPSDIPSGNSTAGSGFVDRAETLLSQPDTLLSQPNTSLIQACAGAVGNWNGTPRC